MSILVSLLSSSSKKRAEYQRTLAELESMSNATAFDLGLYRFDFERMAHKAVYGK